MTSFADSEKRLNAALSRIDNALDRCLAHASGAGLPEAAPDDAALQELRALNASLTQRLAEAEAALAALAAERAAEVAALDEIMDELETMIARGPQSSDAPYAEDVAPGPGEVVAFDKSEG